MFCEAVIELSRKRKLSGKKRKGISGRNGQNEAVAHRKVGHFSLYDIGICRRCREPRAPAPVVLPFFHLKGPRGPITEPQKEEFYE
jgi:hypothetical protein